MQVAFYKADEGRLCTWVATPSRRKPFRGTTMASGRDLPHDLALFVVEGMFGLDWGFWGLLAKGATFKTVPGRRPTKPGRRVISAHRAQLDSAEGIVNTHVKAWRMGMATAASTALNAMLVRWRTLKVGEELRLDWGAPAGGRRTMRCNGRSRSGTELRRLSQGVRLTGQQHCGGKQGRAESSWRPSDWAMPPWSPDDDA
jgi:hypothetical protein